MAGEWLAPLPKDMMTSMQAAVLDMCSTSAVDMTAGREHSLRSLAACTISDGRRVVVVDAI